MLAADAATVRPRRRPSPSTPRLIAAPREGGRGAGQQRPAASPTRFQVSGRSRVVTTGSGGRPYTSGSSSSRKNAPAPPTPSSGSSP